MTPITDAGYRLFHDGQIAFSEMERAGMRIDVDYLNKTSDKIAKQIVELEADLKKDEIYKIWTREFGLKTKLGSDRQILHVLHKCMKYPIAAVTKTNKLSASEEALRNIDHPFVKKWILKNRLKDKVLGTYLNGLRTEVVDGYIHPSINLNTVWTQRSSMTNPNAQNIPARDEEHARTIRSAFIPRPGHRIVENDFKAAEVMASACYHQDPEWVSYCKDPTKDMHRDSMQGLFKVGDISVMSKSEYKGCRNEVKSDFVFASMYGSYYIQCAERMWEQMGRKNLCVAGVNIRDHLKKFGILERGDCNPRQKPRPHTFEDHVQKYENWYWKEKYKEYDAWKNRWCDDYKQRGYIDTLTGFRLKGYFSRNQLIDAPIQGDAFHWLLWVAVRMVKWIKRYKLKSKVICQIHDSLIGDVHDSELDDYLGMVKYLVTEGLKNYWDWICVPIVIEAEVTPVDGNWFTKKEWVL